MNENEMSQLENQLGSWQLRQPSPSIKRGLYPTASAREAASLSLRWLGPVAACLLLALTIASQSDLSGNSARSDAMVGLISSNLSLTNILPQSDTQGRNGVSPASFEWTNRSGSSSSISPFSPGRMN